VATDATPARLEGLQSFHGMVTASPAMRDVFELIRRVGQTDASVLIRGETGTGKELVARALHATSARAEHPFLAVNCATLTSELLASELFGHVRGAFTGAVADRKGLFAMADGGTLFLDEIAEMDRDLQARLLRVLQERTFVPVGGTTPIQVDVRLLAATHTSLRREVERGRFRADLMYRIRVVPLFIPPLRDRTGDVEALTWHFVERHGGPRRIERLGPGVREALLGHGWPGNVRELRNVVEYASAVGQGPELRFEELPPELRGEPPPDGAGHQDLASMERQRILAALGETGGRKAKAAAKLGMSRSTLWRKLREHGLQ
jgi:two-component system response regulator AtoC